MKRFTGVLLLLVVFATGCASNLGPMEQVLVDTMDAALVELSIDPNGDHTVLSRSFDVEGDSLSGSIDVRVDEMLDLGSLKQEILSGTSGWEDGDVSVDGDSLDISFEKNYPVVEVEGRSYIPVVDVTLSVTVEDDGFTDGSYDIDITLEDLD